MEYINLTTKLLGLEDPNIDINTKQKSILDKSIFYEQSSSGTPFPGFESLFLTSICQIKLDSFTNSENTW